MIRRPPRSTPFPYPPPFRSPVFEPRRELPAAPVRVEVADRSAVVVAGDVDREALLQRAEAAPAQRSEEHTSELQSRQYLVCRLLLEKTNTSVGSPLSRLRDL